MDYRYSIAAHKHKFILWIFPKEPVHREELCHIGYYCTCGNELPPIHTLIIHPETKVKLLFLCMKHWKFRKKGRVRCFFNQIFLFAKTALKVFPQWSKSPIVSSVLLPLLSGLPAIFQVFLGVATSAPHLGHLAIILPIYKITDDDHKTFSISNERTNC